MVQNINIVTSSYVTFTINIVKVKCLTWAKGLILLVWPMNTGGLHAYSAKDFIRRNILMNYMIIFLKVLRHLTWDKLEAPASLSDRIHTLLSWNQKITA